MKNFFDLKGLLIAILKRLKMMIILTFILSLGWAMIRFVPLAMKYVADPSQTSITTQSEMLTEEEQPYIYQARRTIYIDPIYVSLNNQVADVAGKIGESYRTFYQNKEILAPLVEEFFTEFQQNDLTWKIKMVDCNYRLNTVLNDQYTLSNFYYQMSVDIPTGNAVNLRVQSNSIELSERMVSRFEELLSAYVAEKCGSFKYTVTEGQIGPWLPDVTPGLTPKTSSGSTGKGYIGVRPTLKEIVVSTAKGGVLGFAGGIAISILLIFFMNVVDISVQNEGSLSEFNLRILAVCSSSKKKKLFSFVDRWIDRLEGYVESPISVADGVKLVCYQLQKLLSSTQTNSSILVSGCAEEAVQEQFSQMMQAAFKKNQINCTVIHSGCATYTPGTIAAATSVDGIILLEAVNKSNVSEIQRELDQFAILEKPVIGFVLLK